MLMTSHCCRQNKRELLALDFLVFWPLTLWCLTLLDRWPVINCRWSHHYLPTSEGELKQRTWYGIWASLHTSVLKGGLSTHITCCSRGDTHALDRAGAVLIFPSVPQAHSCWPITGRSCCLAVTVHLCAMVAAEVSPPAAASCLGTKTCSCVCAPPQ